VRTTKRVHTAIISDLHLCEAEQESEHRPLWKKYKTRQFFFDTSFRQFIEHILRKAGNDPVELVLNGDIFDFDSVVRFDADAHYRTSWLERKRGLRPQEEKSLYKIKTILADHSEWTLAVKYFLSCDASNRLVFVIGNHDLELHFLSVQAEILEALGEPLDSQRVLFCAWFYISEQDTLIEHGNQYDPYCVCQDPINPFIKKAQRMEVRIPFGNLATRYMMNGMGLFNPHVDSNYIMSIPEYMRLFFKYLLRNQPLIMWTWFWGAVVTMFQSLRDRLLPELKDPMRVEDRIEEIAKNSNATPRMVRELRELFAYPAASHPWLIAQELWLDRAFLVMLAFLAIFQIFTFFKLAYEVEFYWFLGVLALFIPFFVFYTKSIRSSVAKFKEPNERLLVLTSRITGVKRVVYGHTHVARHEMIGYVEHLNSGCWSPAFLDVECTRPYGKKTFVWIYPTDENSRDAKLFEFSSGQSKQVYGRLKLEA